MKEHYVTYECAVKLKELGFDWDVRGYYRNDDTIPKVREITALNHNDANFKSILSAPRLDQAQAWLRDKGVIVIAEPDWDEEIQPLSDYLTGKWYFTVWKDSNRVRCNFNPNKECEEIWVFESYESALSAGIDEALKLLGKEVNNGM